MPRIEYIQKNLRASTLDLIDKANQIIRTYQAQGYSLTLRQLYYQFVSKNWIPNKQREYNRLGKAVSTGRLCGLIDWNAINDNLRELESNSHWGSPGEIIEAVANQYSIDMWQNQKYRPEVWIEKDALSSIVRRACEPLDVPYLVCRGYASQTAVWKAGMRMETFIMDGQTPVVFHFGDHDPSGIDMTRDNRDRLQLFTGGGFDFKRIALNMNQVQKHNPPPNPVKQTDSRGTGYEIKYGKTCWELDALDPATLEALIKKCINSVRDKKKWKDMVQKEADEKKQLQAVSDNWDSVVEHLEDTGEL